MESCDCIHINASIPAVVATFDEDVQSTGEFNGSNTFEFELDGVTYFVWNSNILGWLITTTPIGDDTLTVATLDFKDDVCPVASKPDWITTLFDVLTTSVGSCGVCCIITHLKLDLFTVEHEEFPTPQGFWNDSPYWQWCDNQTNTGWILFKQIEVGGCRWVVGSIKCAVPPATITGNETIKFEGELSQDCFCPSETTFVSIIGPENIFSVSNCPVDCVSVEDRHQRKYDAIKLPEVFEEEDRGFAKCCEKFLVLANGTTKTDENDMSSAWIQLSSPADTVEFLIVDDNGDPASFQPDTVEFPNQPNAFYFTVHWKDILASIDDGVGCYSIQVAYNISGIEVTFVWRYFELRLFTIEEALCTARIRVKLNMNQSIEGINFTGANVEDSIRFNGQIKKDQANTEIDNLWYSERDNKTVVNENIPTYLIKTDPYTDEVLRLFVELYLLSANEMFISDHNAHTSSYRIKDIPVTIQESAERSAPDEFSRFEILTCIVQNRFANERTFY